MLNSNTFLTVDEVAASVADSVNDPNYRVKSLGWYRDYIKRALEKVSLKAKISTAVSVMTSDANGFVDLPPLYKEITCVKGLDINAQGDIVATRVIFPRKSTMVVGTTNVPVSGNDGISYNDGINIPTVMTGTQVNYYTKVNGKLWLSPTAQESDLILIEHTLWGHAIDTPGSAKIVPRECREYVEAFVAEAYWNHRAAESPSLRVMWSDKYNVLNGKSDGNMTLLDTTIRNISKASEDAIEVAISQYMRSL